jgi:predicted Rossmann fold nucleotide-binding protein DprA/Smf involved in DNA uptake
MVPIRIVSGGQTGADGAALDFAIEHGIPHRGWCPKGRLAEDGVIPTSYHLRETSTKAYAWRTKLNVQDSDGTVIFTVSATVKGGSLRTWLFAQEHNKPVLHLPRTVGATRAENELRAFIETNGIKILNVAGSRASKEPEVGSLVQQILAAALLPSPALAH